MADNVRKWLSDSFGYPRGAAAQPIAPRRVVALEIHSPQDWRYVCGEIDDDRLTVTAAGTTSEGTRMDTIAANATVVLVANSERSICRVLDVASASPEQTRNMVALRLETELPYPVADAMWVCDRTPASNGNGTHVLVVAVPETDVRSAQNALRARGLQCEDVEYDAAALAELVRVSPEENDIVAIARIENRRTVLTLVQNNIPRYVRRIGMPGLPAQEAMNQNGWTARVAGELVQSLYDHRMRTDSRAPSRLLVTGEAAGNRDLLAALEARMSIPVQAAPVPSALTIADDATIDGDLIANYPACLGVLLAIHRRQQGGRAAAPSLRSSGQAGAAMEVRNRRAVLVLAVVLLLAALVGSLFAVRSAKLYAAESAIKEMKPLARDLARLQDEVDILQYESKRQRSTLDILAALAGALPEELTTETITLTPEGKLSIKGRTSSVTAASDKAIAALTESGMFTKCAFLGATEEKGAFVFQISCELSKSQGKASQ